MKSKGWKVIFSKDNSYVARVRPTDEARVEFQVFSICCYQGDTPVSMVTEDCGDTADFEEAMVIIEGEIRWDLDVFLTFPEKFQTSARSMIEIGKFLQELEDQLSDDSFLKPDKALERKEADEAP